MSDHTLRPSIEQALSAKKWSLVKLAEETGINRSVFSNTLRAKDPTPISFSLLEKITLALGHEEDYFFEAYINECFLGGKSNKSRVRPFLIRCGELGKARYIERVLERLEAENEERHLELIFGIAEELTRSGNDSGALPLYHWIIKLDKNIQSERVAVSQYRIMLINKSDDHEKNFELVLKTSRVRRNLPVSLRLHALHVMMNFSNNVRRYRESEQFADESLKLIDRLLASGKDADLNKYPMISPLIFFYGSSQLQKEFFLTEAKNYREAKKYPAKYKDLTWFPNLDDITLKYIERFNKYAYLNELSLEIMSGNFSPLDEYVALLEKNPQEVLLGVITVLDAAIEHNYLIDDFLKKFQVELQAYISIKGNVYNVQSSYDRFFYFSQRLSVYLYQNKRYEESLQAAMQSWEFSKKFNNHSHLRMLASLAVMYNTAPAE